MKLPSLLPLLCLSLNQVIFVVGLVTLETIRDLTKLTDELRERILETGPASRVERDPMVEVLGGQRVLGGGDEDGDDIEDVVAAALKVMCSELLIELEKPLVSAPSSSILGGVEEEDLRCRVTRRGYHNFLEATVKFLHEVQERQERWVWGHESVVFDGVGWLQGLWASRKMNIQDRSFIEQQLILYDDTGCFGKTKEVLRSGVEVVEYLNDLLDSFP
ncbi:uncharacterized protein PAC_07977 [Phialocephala subalpina]|uniref:Uncharacterized protein n=1 Tax=Phialocephala subalpina TaxID=576137 RepID=A0A1L7WZ95_9HELO|nr:uncharacterized protein PAC_07977 [Phialocephala subalpina]